MIIRGWRFTDIYRLAEMEEENFPKEPWSYKMLVSSFESPNFIGLVAEDGGEIIGYGGVTVQVDSADIDNIAVSENFRNAGVGTALLRALIDSVKSKGVNKVFLEVRVSNTIALMLYLKQGFNGVYTRNRYYKDGEDCIVLCKEIEV